MRFRPVSTLLFAIAAACDRGGISVATSRASGPVPRVAINEVMANPRATPDERGEWIELRSLEPTPTDLRGWTVASGNDRGITIAPSVVIPPNGIALLARDGDQSITGATPAFVYGSGLTLGNAADWIALRLPDGRTVDSVAWTSTTAGASRALGDATDPHANLAGAAWHTSTSRFGARDLGTPGIANDASPNAREAPLAGTTSSTAPAPPAAAPASSGPPGRDSTVTVRVLDVGQGDAILIENGGSRVLVDGGPDIARFGRLLDQLHLDGATIDAVILTHQHYDHYSGLRELFRTRRNISVRTVFENKDAYSNPSLSQLRDSIIARARRGQLTYRDTDDPCGNGAPTCTVTMRGGARLQVMRPDPDGEGPNNRSVAVRLLAPDSSRFSMWLAGDAEQQAIRWFDATEYDRRPGMQATLLKGDHHGSCDGISPRYLDLVRPQAVALSLAATNDYGYVHAQTLELLERRRIPWYRTDQNGTITITVPPRAAFAISVERGRANMRGPSDRPARNCGDDERR
ncbi:MAG TPA: MBL fold metallo-hydrolase [Gemmatimonadaceae bacterium]|nr:MBL fold metallo-hydrolase [Gemmatimonadaceae bacterium]